MTRTNSASERPPQASRVRARWGKRAVWGLLVIGAVAVIVLAVWPEPVPVDTSAVERESLVVTVDEDGRTRIEDRYVISAPLGGQVARIDLEPGDAVVVGQVLARIEPTSAPLLDPRSRQTAQARLSAASAAREQALARVDGVRSALAFAEQDAEQLGRLSQGDIVSTREAERARLEVQTLRADVASAELAVKVAAHEIEMARAALGHVTRGSAGEQMPVTSPIDGRVLDILQTSEGVVQPGTPLVALGDPRALEVVVDVLTRDAVLIEPHAPVTLVQWGGEDLGGRVRLVEPSAFTRLSSLGVEEQRVNVVIDITAPPGDWATLGDGYRVEARIEVWRGDDVLVVPGSAVFRSGTGWALFAVEDDVARLRPVAIGQRSGTMTQITEGVAEGDVVVTYPSDRIEDGVSVAAR